MRQGAAHVAEDEVDDAAGGRGEAHDAQLVIDENGADVGAGQQVVHVIVGPREAEDFGLEFGVDRIEFLVERLQLLLGGLEFFVGRLQFFVDGLHFLVGGLEFLAGALQLFVGAAEVFLLGLQLLPEGGQAGGSGPAGARAGGGGGGGGFFENDEKERRVRIFSQGNGAHGEVGGDGVSSAGEGHAGGAHDFGAMRGFVQGGGEGGAQSFAGHLEDVADAGFAGGRFEVETGAAVEIEDVALGVDQCADQAGVGEQLALGEFADRYFGGGEGAVDGIAERGRLVGEERRRERGVVGGEAVFGAAVKFGFGIDGGKERGGLAHAFRIAEEEDAAGVERVVEQWDDFLLQLGGEVNEEVAAADEVEFGERRVFDDVVLGEDEHVADAFVQAVDAAVRIGGEKAGEAFGGDIGRNARGINPRAGGGDGAAVDIRGKKLDRVAAFERLHAFGEEDGQGVSFLAGRAADDPEAERGAGRAIFEEPDHDLFFHHGESLGVAEEAGHIDEQIAEEGFHLFGAFREVGDVVIELIDLVEGHAALDATVDRARFVEREVVAGLGAELEENFAQRILRFGRRRETERAAAGEVRGIGDELGRHFGRGHDVVDQAGGDGTAGHAVEFRRLRILREDEAVLALDGAHAEGTVRSGAGKNDADGTLALVLGEGVEEEIDG